MIGLVVLLAGTAHPPANAGNAKVIAAVKANLNDPDSAKFRDIKKTGPDSYCGWVNAKNGYGGYAGDQLFYDDAGFVQVFDLPAAFDPGDLAEQSHLFATGDTDRALAMKPRLSEDGRKVEPCLKDHQGN
ncbi:MAG: hypothetical protein ACTHOI_02165 [Sphingomicrobium sp.]